MYALQAMLMYDLRINNIFIKSSILWKLFIVYPTFIFFWITNDGANYCQDMNNHFLDCLLWH